MSDDYDYDCPSPADHDSRDALPPSRQFASPTVTPGSAASAMTGFDPREQQERWQRDQMALLVDPGPHGECPLRRDLGEAEQLIKSVTDRITLNLTVHLDECQGLIDQCHANICGAHDLTMDWCEAEIAKRQTKIDNFLVLKLAQVYNLLARFGVTYEPDDVVRERMHGPVGEPAMGDAGEARQIGQNFPDRKMRPDAMPDGAQPGIDAGTGSGDLVPGLLLPSISQSGAQSLLQAPQPRSNLGMTEYPHCLPVRLCVDPDSVPAPLPADLAADLQYPFSPERESAGAGVN